MLVSVQIRSPHKRYAADNIADKHRQHIPKKLLFLKRTDTSFQAA